MDETTALRPRSVTFVAANRRSTSAASSLWREQRSCSPTREGPSWSHTTRGTRRASQQHEPPEWAQSSPRMHTIRELRLGRLTRGAGASNSQGDRASSDLAPSSSARAAVSAFTSRGSRPLSIWRRSSRAFSCALAIDHASRPPIVMRSVRPMNSLWNTYARAPLAVARVPKTGAAASHRNASDLASGQPKRAMRAAVKLTLATLSPTSYMAACVTGHVRGILESQSTPVYRLRPLQRRFHRERSQSINVGECGQTLLLARS